MDIYSNVKQAFNDNCKVVDLRKEYGDSCGCEKFAIVTNLTEEQLNSLYEEHITGLRPFIVLTPDVGEVIGLFWSNEKKHEKRHERSEIEFPAAETKEEVRYGLFVPDDQYLKELEENRKEKIARVREALKTLTPLQRKRLIDYHLLDRSLKEIGDEEGVSVASISYSMKKAEKNFIAAYEKLEVAS